MRVSSPEDPAEREAVDVARRVVRMPSSGSRSGGGQHLARAADRQSASRRADAATSARVRPGLFRHISDRPLPGVAADGSTQVHRAEVAGPTRAGLNSSGFLRRASRAGPLLAPSGRSEDRSVAPAVESEIGLAMASGTPLAADVRETMEPRFGTDFGAVRVHRDDRAGRLAAKLRARAFTIGPHIFFGRGEYRPEREDGAELVAHELTHTIQQGAVERPAETSPGRAGGLGTPVRQQPDREVHRLGIGDALDYFAERAYLIMGFRMFTLLIGINPINMSRVDRTAANLLRALVELLPGGGFLTQALDAHGVFDTAGAWVEQQLKTLGLTGRSIRNAIDRFLDGLSWTDITRLGAVWEDAKRIFTEPIERVIDFGASLIQGILDFIRDAILQPLAERASETDGWDLLCAVIGTNPITGDDVPRTAENMIGGFMKLIGQEEVWENIKKGNAVERAWAWFQGALEGLVGFVREIPTLFLQALKEIEVADIILIPRAFAKVAGVFAGFAVRFITWAGQQVFNLLEIIFEVVAPQVMVYVRRAGGALRTIIENPIGFVGNLVAAGKLGFRQFKTKFVSHLRASLIGWLTGAMSGANLYIPQGLNLQEILKFVLSVLGLTWQNIRTKLVRVIGEPAVAAMETGFDLVMTLVREGPAAAWQQILESVGNLRDMVIEQVITFVRNRVVVAAVTKLVSMLNPAGAFIQAIIATYNTVMFFVERLQQIARVAMAFIDSIAAIANGVLTQAANRVERTMAGMLTLVISFLARFAGLGNVSQAVTRLIDQVRQPIDRGLDRVVGWLIKQARRLAGRRGSTARAPTLTAAQGLAAVKQRANALGGSLRGSNNDAAGPTVSAFYQKEKDWVEKNVIPSGSTPPKLLLIPSHDENTFWLDLKINPIDVTTKWPRGTGGVQGSGRGRMIGMFHGSLSRISSLGEIDMSKLQGEGDGRGLELGSGLYLTHFFSDVKGYAPPPNGIVHRILVPENILRSASEAKPDTSGDKSWEGKGEVIKGSWLHIGSQGWKAGFQWCIKSEDIVKYRLILDDALPVYEAADLWGRGRMNEFPNLRSRKLTAATESVASGRRLAAAGAAQNPHERGGFQTSGESTSS